MYDKAQMDTIPPQERMGQHGAGLASPAHDAAVRDGISVPRGARVLRIKDVIDRTGLSRSTLYALMKSDPTFPKKVSLSVRTTGVIEQQLDAWIAMRASLRAVA
ncbi:helix-turn-helix transcriptional regulator [Paraburkholderia graminis]|uniref:helix-turn-helix transcriptional regulator n=1 Tax=Paraburkholderia graminis TaxID=60548 RepID=UPI0038B87904